VRSRAASERSHDRLEAFDCLPRRAVMVHHGEADALQTGQDDADGASGRWRVSPPPCLRMSAVRGSRLRGPHGVRYGRLARSLRCAHLWGGTTGASVPPRVESAGQLPRMRAGADSPGKGSAACDGPASRYTPVLAIPSDADATSSASFQARDQSGDCQPKCLSLRSIA
jgi:hypothetical protein